MDGFCTATGSNDEWSAKTAVSMAAEKGLCYKETKNLKHWVERFDGPSAEYIPDGEITLE